MKTISALSIPAKRVSVEPKRHLLSKSKLISSVLFAHKSPFRYLTKLPTKIFFRRGFSCSSKTDIALLRFQFELSKF
jgi:hypothetical protein